VTTEQTDVHDDGEVFMGMALEVERLNKAKGWYQKNRSFGDEIALLHSEVSEALEAYRVHGTKALHGYAAEGGPTLVEVGSPNDIIWRKGGYGLPKPEGVASELADVLVRLLDTCRRYDIDLFAIWREKMDYNWTRPERHGGKNL
jgi:NTP pyrophosphatase (non-canonical NTP hydrolase)